MFTYMINGNIIEKGVLDVDYIIRIGRWINLKLHITYNRIYYPMYNII